jgi:hypothetical protein
VFARIFFGFAQLGSYVEVMTLDSTHLKAHPVAASFSKEGVAGN